MSIFTGDPKWIRFFGGRKFAMAMIVLALASCAFFCTVRLDGYQFGGILLTALGLYSYNNRKQKGFESSQTTTFSVQDPDKK